jgi:hypothetical protein
MEGDQMTDQQQEARTLTLGERIVLIARLAVEEHLRQSVTEVPLDDQSYFARTDFREMPLLQNRELENRWLENRELEHHAMVNPEPATTSLARAA